MITFGVFFPALMSAGILVSGVILLSDVVRRLMPNRGQRRRYRVARSRGDRRDHRCRSGLSGDDCGPEASAERFRSRPDHSW